MSEPYDIVIIGAGVAGLTAALYALRANKSVLLLEASVYGGQIITTSRIDNYPATPGISGADFARAIYEQVSSFGAIFAYARATSVKKSPDFFTITTDDPDLTLRARSVILANGSSERRLGLPGEDRLLGRGLSYCATCDGAFFRAKTVAVYGAGNTAFHDTLYLSSLAKKVYLISRSADFRADPILVDKVRALPNLKILPSTTLISLNGDQKLTSLALSTNDTPTGKHEFSLPVDGLFVAIGRVADNSFVSDLVDLDPSGYIISDENGTTKTPGLFCAGDTRHKNLHQLVGATSDGASAATSAIAYVNS